MSISIDGLEHCHLGKTNFFLGKCLKRTSHTFSTRLLFKRVYISFDCGLSSHTFPAYAPHIVTSNLVCSVFFMNDIWSPPFVFFFFKILTFFPRSGLFRHDNHTLGFILNITRFLSFTVHCLFHVHPTSCFDFFLKTPLWLIIISIKLILICSFTHNMRSPLT